MEVSKLLQQRAELKARLQSDAVESKKTEIWQDIASVREELERIDEFLSDAQDAIDGADEFASCLNDLTNADEYGNELSNLLPNHQDSLEQLASIEDEVKSLDRHIKKQQQPAQDKSA